MIEKHNVDPINRRDEWLALRKRDVTASVVGSLFDVNPYKTRFELWHEKAGNVDEPFSETEATIRGKLMEPVAFKLIEMKNKTWRLKTPDVYLTDTALRMGATPDAYVKIPGREGFGIIQIKTSERTTFRRNWVTASGEIEPPLWIALQAIQEAELSGAAYAIIAVVVMDFGLTLELVDVPLNKKLVAAMKQKVSEFWDSIEKRTPPPPDYSRDGDAINRVYSDDNGRELDMSRDNRMPEILAERSTIYARMSEDKKRVAEIEAEIRFKLGDYDRAYVPGWSIKRTVVSKKGHWVEASTYSRLGIKEAKE